MRFIICKIKSKIPYINLLLKTILLIWKPDSNVRDIQLCFKNVSYFL